MTASTTKPHWAIFVSVDREIAFNATIAAAEEIRTLQATNLWVALSIETRRAICQAHANLTTMATAMEDAGLF
jgi:hypothetical protein